VVIVAHTTEKIVLAADSRLVGVLPDQRDTNCKISAFGERMIFSLSGMNSGLIGPSRRFNATENANQVWRELGPAAAAADYAGAWGRIMAEGLRQAFEFQGKSLLDALEQRGPVISMGIFAATKEGGVELAYAELLWDGKPPFNPVAKVIPIELKRGPVFQLSAVGGNGPAAEMVVGQSPDAIKERKEWDRLRLNQEQVPVRLAEMEIRLAPPNGDVGGSIDAVAITSEGITWIQRKANCPASAPEAP